MSYSQKIIQTLKPEWYLSLSKTEKIKQQNDLKERHKSEYNKKPELLKSGTILIAKQTTNSITKNNKYKLINHFCTLISTIYDSEWNHFVTIKNDNGYTVKMNLRNFDYEK